MLTSSPPVGHPHPIHVSPSSLDFPIVYGNGIDNAMPVGSCVLTILRPVDEKPTTDSSSNSFLAFSVRASIPTAVKIKGGWGQILAPGEKVRVQVALRKGFTSKVDDGELRLWITYELLQPHDDAERTALQQKWLDQQRIRSAGELLSSRSEAAASSSSLWKGRNFDLLNSNSVVVQCRCSAVRSEQTAELDLIRDQVRLKKAHLAELLSSCDKLVQEGVDVVERMKQGPQKKKGTATIKKAFALRSFTDEVEWIEIVGMMLVMSSTALLVLAL